MPVSRSRLNGLVRCRDGFGGGIGASGMRKCSWSWQVQDILATKMFWQGRVWAFKIPLHHMHVNSRTGYHSSRDRIMD